MCGRFALDAPKAKIEERFGVSLSGIDYKPRINIAPHQGILAIVDDHGQRKALPTLWGFIPVWVKDLEKIQPPINARLETVDTNKFFKYSFKNRRCLIPVSSFYEWDKNTKPKTPYRFYNPDEPLFALAGLWSPFMDSEGNEVDTGVILTTSANKDVSWLHDRMPLIIGEKDWNGWLEGSLNEFLGTQDHTLSYEAISPKINNPRFEP